MAQEVQKRRNVAEYAVHFEFYANVRHIVQTLNLERVRLLGDHYQPFIVLPEAKDPAEMGQKRLDLLIHDGQRFAIELKVDATSEEEVTAAISQLEDYADGIDADEAYLIIYTEKLPSLYKQMASLTGAIIIWLVCKEQHRKLEFVIADQSVVEITLQSRN
jgi:hypothetical protein